ncbi:protein of unknown function [Taphrina deformans PYCC 5710]|uniref:Uncharacterized protein n=1 Tax=Taphrina deformans (strain PYCC 5710 / ATCC 11124 / CBS 356.35 / IMI 108563 / JCM 9778 / NBRC 8474) TaxID=1097556 RepID=R4XA75_TAPDE|nr:protein of unknown function [Taphrina deformans PYCC 5710]|eukprot:CCG81174.1 protein of unknown function [Taphrina deformans PYCC 5710]
MSDDATHKVEDYLQFTPLASAVSVRPLIESFVIPEVVVALPRHVTQANDFTTSAGHERILSNVLRLTNYKRIVPLTLA